MFKIQRRKRKASIATSSMSDIGFLLLISWKKLRKKRIWKSGLKETAEFLLKEISFLRKIWSCCLQEKLQKSLEPAFT